MKKLLLASTALALMGGAAYAQDINISAEASASYGNWEDYGDGDNPNAQLELGTTVTIGLEGASGGLTYGGELTVEDLDSVELGPIFVAGGFGKLEFNEDEWDTVDDEQGDVRYSYMMSGFDIAVIMNAQGFGDGAGGQGRVSLGYGGTGFNLGLDYDTDDTWTVSGDVTVGSFVIGAELNDDDTWKLSASTTAGGVDVTVTYDDADVIGLELAGSTGGVDWELNGDSNGTGDGSVSTTFGATTVKLTYDHEGGTTARGDTGDDARTVLSIEQAIGNVTLGAKVNDADEYEGSITAAFTF